MEDQEKIPYWMTDKYQDVCAICAETTPDEAKELVEGILKFETPDLWENSALTRERFIESQMTMWLTGQLIGTDEERDAECRIMRILNARKDEDYEARRKAQETGTGSLQCGAARSRRTSGAAGAKKPEKIKG